MLTGLVSYRPMVHKQLWCQLIQEECMSRIQLLQSMRLSKLKSLGPMGRSTAGGSAQSRVAGRVGMLELLSFVVLLSSLEQAKSC